MNYFRFMLLLVFLLGGQYIAHTQESEPELSEKALKLFNNEKYTEATPLYLRLLAFNKSSHDYNFRYGTCLLFNSNKKQDAFKYLNYSVASPTIDMEAYFYLGKAFHLNYQFNEAIKNYELYKQKAGSKINPALEIDRQIEMCQNGKRLLTTITDLVVLEKKEIDIDKFFRLYDLKNIGGDIIVAADFQSKVDKKRNHLPLIHFPANSSKVYYASYGETDKGQKDVYSRNKLPDGTWSLPQMVQGNVNSTSDEDFPYMHPNGQFLYFCSKGHNSMGGYDVFRSRIESESGVFGPPENMDFAISSPDNDLFYVVDSLDDYAYFASSRQSQNSKMYVYKVRVDRVPLQLAVVKGTFNSSINPSNKKINFTITDFASGEKIGNFASREDKGTYLITFPKGGKYTYEMNVEGSDIKHKYVVTIPFTKEFKPLKQKIIEETVDNTEIVRVIDLFDEAVEDPLGVMAEVIKQRSELNPNAGQFDLAKLDAEKDNQKILAELGFENASPSEIVSSFEAIENQVEEKIKEQENLVNGALTQALNQLVKADELQNEAKQLVNESTSETTDEGKYKLLIEAQNKMNEAIINKEAAFNMMFFGDSIADKLPKEQELYGAIQAISKEVRKEVTENNPAGLKELLTSNVGLFEQIKTSDKTNPIDALINQKSELNKEKNKSQQQYDAYEKTERSLESEIKLLKESLAVAKKKDAPAIESSIASKTNELNLVTEEKNRLEKKIEKIADKEKPIDQRIVFLQNVSAVNTSKVVSKEEVATKLADVDTKNSSTLASYIDKQVADYAAKNPDLVADSKGNNANNKGNESNQGNTSVIETVDVVEVTSDSEREKLLPSYDNDLANASGADQKVTLEAKKEIEERLLSRVDTELQSVKNKLDQTPNDANLKARKTALEQLKKETEDNISDRESALLNLNTLTESPESVRDGLNPNYENELANARGADQKSTLEAKKEVEERLLSRVDAELQSVKSKLNQTPNDANLKARKTALEQLKKETEDNISDREIALLNLNTLTESPETVRDGLNPNYESELANARGTDEKSTLDAQNRVDERLLSEVNESIQTAEAQLNKDPANTQLQARKIALEQLKTDTESSIAKRDTKIAAIGSVSEFSQINPDSERQRLASEYENEISNARGTDEKSALEAKNAVDKRLLSTVNNELENVGSQLKQNPSDKKLQAQQSALERLKTDTESEIASREKEIAILTGKTPTAEASVLAAALEVRPSYSSTIDKIKTTTEPGLEQETALLKEERALETAISKEIKSLESKVLRNPADAEAQDKLKALKTAQSTQQTAIKSREQDLVDIEQSKINTQQLQADIDPELQQIDPANITNLSPEQKDAQLKSEQQLQQLLVNRQKANERKMGADFNPTLEAENKVIANLIAQSVNRTELMNQPAVTVEIEQAITAISNDLGSNANDLLNKKPTSIEEAKQILSELKAYDNQLTATANKLEDTDSDDQEAIALNQQQRSIIKKRIGVIEVDLNEFENIARVNTSGSEAEKAVASISAEEQVLKTQLAAGNLSPKEQKTTEKQLVTLQTKREKQEQIVLKEELVDLQVERQNEEATLSQRSANSKLGQQVAKRVTDLTTKDDTEKGNNLYSDQLNQRVQREQQALNLLEATNSFLATELVLRDSYVVIETENSLKEKKRQFLIEIGQLEAEITRYKDDPEKALKVLELKDQRFALDEASQRVEILIQQLQKEYTIKDKNTRGLETNITYEEEVAIASSENYPKLVERNDAIRATEKDIKTIVEQKNQVRSDLVNTTDFSQRASLITTLKNLEGREQELRSVLKQQQNELELAVTQENGDPMKLKNLLAREIAPMIAVAVIATTISPAIANDGFELVANPGVVRPDRILPVDAKLPSGLVYRVQVGAFAKPVPENLFKEFTPVTGEKLTNGITRYLAGYFGNRNRVVQAREQIRAIGYNDAFVVAYCDGERITLAEARRLEDAGLCIPKNQNEINIEAIANVAAQLPEDSTRKLVTQIKKTDYNKAPGAAPAEALEERTGLFYTVQIGVFNKPVATAQVKNITPLVTKRLDNGQIRYSSGIFQTVDAAKPKKAEAIARGIKDAFITAYYNGERISLVDAEKIIAESGQQVVESKGITTVKEEELSEAKAYAENTASTEVVKVEPQVQIKTKKQFDEYPRDVLNRYNAFGSFYYDATDKYVKSVNYSSKDALPQLFYLKDEIDTVFLTKNSYSSEPNKMRVVAVWESFNMSGEMGEWLLRLPVPHEGIITETGYEMRFDKVSKVTLEQFKTELSLFGAKEIKVEEGIKYY